MKFSDMTIRTLDLPPRGQQTHFDDTLPGFGIRISQGGTKTFVVIHGRSRQRTTIGKYGVIGLADARKRAREILAEQVLGKTRAPTHMPFGEVVDVPRQSRWECATIRMGISLRGCRRRCA